MKSKLTRIYHHYQKWEDFHAGMYRSAGEIENYEEMIINAKNLLCNESEFYQIALQVITKWPLASEQNLTNIGANRQSWIGQASCCMKYNVPEELTRTAWASMTDIERDRANLIADEIINKFERLFNERKN